MSNYLERVEEVASTIVRENAIDVDGKGEFPQASIKALGEAGLLGLLSAKEVGGMGESLRAGVEVVSRLAQECGSTAMVTCMHFCGTIVLENHGPESVRKDIAQGNHLTTLAFSERGSRSHFWAPVSSATKKGKGYLLNAQKSWVTSANNADSYVWSSQPVEAEGASSIWLVRRTSKGLQTPGSFDGLGLRGNDSTPIEATDVAVSQADLLGADGAGFDIMMELVLPYFCLMSAACSLGFMEAATLRTAAHASGARYEYLGSALKELPTIRAYIARMRCKADLVKSLVFDAVSAIETGREDAQLRVLESKACAGELAREVLELGMRVCGGVAFRGDVGVERYFRDSQAAGVMAPTTDVLYDFIGRAVTGMPLF